MKSDDHMMKVQSRIVTLKRSEEEAETRKKQREYKKYAKAVQGEKVKEKDATKKANVIAASKNKGKGKDGKMTMDGDMERDAKGAGFMQSKKRIAMDKKFGHGGKKADMKRNSRASTDDFSSFSIKGNKQAFAGNKGKQQQGVKGKGSFDSKRPPKASDRRSASKGPGGSAKKGAGGAKKKIRPGKSKRMGGAK